MIVKTIYCPEIIYITNYPYFTSIGLVVWVLYSQYRVCRFKNTGWLQADSDFDPSLVNQMNIRKSWNLVTQRKLSPCSGSVSQRQLNYGFGPTPIIMGGLNLKIRQNFVGQYPQKWSVSIRICSGNLNASVVVTSQYPQIHEKIP